MILYLRPKPLKRHTLWRRTYLYSLYKGVTPPPDICLLLEFYPKGFFLLYITNKQMKITNFSSKKAYPPLFPGVSFIFFTLFIFKQAAFFRIQKRICDLRSYGFITTEKTEDPKEDHLPGQQHVLVPLVMRKIEEKNNKQLILTAKTRGKRNKNYL